MLRILYSCAIVTFTLRSAVFLMFDVKKCRDIEVSEVVSFDRLCIISYYCSLVTLSIKCTVFEIFHFQNAMTLKTGLGVRQGHWKCRRSIERI